MPAKHAAMHFIADCALGSRAPARLNQGRSAALIRLRIEREAVLEMLFDMGKSKSPINVADATNQQKSDCWMDTTIRDIRGHLMSNGSVVSAMQARSMDFERWLLGERP
jgi:hypothetical protein